MAFAPKTPLGGEEDAPNAGWPVVFEGAPNAGRPAVLEDAPNAGRPVVVEDAPNIGPPVVLCEGPFVIEIAGVPKEERVVVEGE